MAMDPNVMGWDDVLENDGQEFITLPEGDYTFTVTAFERGQFPGVVPLGGEGNEDLHAPALQRVDAADGARETAGAPDAVMDRLRSVQADLDEDR